MSIPDLKEKFDHAIWNINLDSLPRWQAKTAYMFQVLYAVIRDMVGGLPTLRAMGLVYTTLLSLIPLLAFCFSVLKGFGVHNKLEPLLLTLLEPLGEKGAELSVYIVGFVDKMDVKVLGSLGLGLLLFTVISLLKKIEMAFNYTWRVTEFRNMTQRFSDYISVLLIGPLLIITAIGITASISNIDAFAELHSIPYMGMLIEFSARLIPYILVICAFTFVYILIPNTRVRFKSALIGAIIAGVLWESANWLFASFIAGSRNYTAIYSSFAILFIFIIWLYINWLIILTGASIAFYHQHPERLSARQQVLRLSCRLRERIALLIMSTVASSFHNNESPWTLYRLSRQLDISVEALLLVLCSLEDHNLLIQVTDKKNRNRDPAWLPTRALASIYIYEIFEAVRTAEESRYLSPDNLTSNKSIDEVIATLEEAISNSLGDMTLEDVVIKMSL